MEKTTFLQSEIFGQTTLNTIFSQKLSNCHISLWRKVFFSIFNQFFFHSYQSCPQLRRVTNKNVNAVAYWEHGIWPFSKKN
jgi:hypothetical protein